MKKYWEIFRKRFYSPETSQNLVLFNIIIPILIISGTVSLVVSLFARMPLMQQVVVLLAIVVLVLGFYLANWRQKLNLGAFLISALITLVLYPMMFFTGGGPESGMGYWMVLGILFSFLLIDGMLFRVLVPLQMCSVLVCFAIAYFYPDTVVPIESKASAYMDIVQSMMILSICVGLIFRFEKKFYQRVIREVNEKNEEIRLAKQRAESANRVKSTFLSHFSHEIRTPLNSIVGMNEMILRSSENAEIKEYANQIQGAADVLLTDINNVLDISNIESGKFELANGEYQVASLITDCYHLICKRAENKQLALHFVCDEQLPQALYGDMVHIRQIWMNLLTNAVKYTDSGSVTAKISACNQDSRFQLQMEVSDTGRGIGEEDKKRLFGAFERMDMKKNQTIEGVGLGLHITYQLVREMHGTIAVQSAYEKGSTFTVTIPQMIINDRPIGVMDVTGASADAQLPQEQVYAPDVCILAVDDVDINLKVVRNLLKETQMTVEFAESGKECLEKTAVKSYDLIIMDQMMPKMDGITTLQNIRRQSDGKNQATPVVMLTASAMAGEKERCMAAGFCDYMTKPVRQETLLHTIVKYLPKDKITVQESPAEHTEAVSLKETQNPQPEEQQRKEAQQEEAIAPAAALGEEFDKAQALAYCANDEGLLWEMIKDFVREERMTEIEEYYAQKDWDTYRIKVHALKSTALTLGFVRLHEDAKAVELAVKEGNLSFAEKHHKPLMQHYRQIMELADIIRSDLGEDAHER